MPLNINTPTQLFLAPMEGVVDPVLRKLLTNIGGIDFCVTEFIRVTHHELSEKEFLKYAPELNTHCLTHAKIPVMIQLLGSDPHWLAINAQKAVQLGAKHIDLNFGCPAKTVNRHEGGACLLQYPDRLNIITESVRKVLPTQISLSVKVRLGYNDELLLKQNIQAISSAEPNWITIHARTKADGYLPPARWQHIALAKSYTKIPIVANGDIVDIESLKNCSEQSHCHHFMIGRGVLRDPFLFLKLKNFINNQPIKEFTWKNCLDFILLFSTESCSYKGPQYGLTRTKQLLSYLKNNYQEATLLFEKVKTLKDYNSLIKTLEFEKH